MYEYIKGAIHELKPTYAVIDVQGVGYFIEISVNTYAQLENKGQVMLYIHHHVREDAHKLYGFISKHEREVFRSLTTKSEACNPAVRSSRS